MTNPTLLSPWYVVQKEIGNKMQYFTAEQPEGGDHFTESKKKATLFLSIHSAARVAKAEVADVRVLFSDECHQEFRDK